MERLPFTVNGRHYEPPSDPVVVICVDGSEPAYHERALAAGRMPWLARQLGGQAAREPEGMAASWPAECAMPALTNPNNVSIATGRPPSEHGISGNYLLDVESGEEVLMNDKRFLRIPTIFAAAAAAGHDVAVVTAKDKLRRLLGAGLVDDGAELPGHGSTPTNPGICFSAQHADRATVADNGIGDVLEWVGRPLPRVYSADLSEFVLAAGATILAERRPDLMYLSLTDYIQHKHAPGTPVADDFYAMLDHWAGELDALGAVVVITADHGMSAKTDDAGAPQVIYLEEEVQRLPGGAEAQVILPITDPYTVHHGALGSFASVHLRDPADSAAIGAAVGALPGVQSVHQRADAAGRYGLPADRIGDLVVLADKGHALGRSRRWHDLGQLDAPLRSHGALGESRIPFIINRRLVPPPPLHGAASALPYPDGSGWEPLLHNYDAFWVATTGVTRGSAAEVRDV